jgi:hypothetical protein
VILLVVNGEAIGERGSEQLGYVMEVSNAA